MEIKVKNSKSGKRGGMDFEAATLEIVDARIDTGQFNPRNTPCVTVRLKSATNNVAVYDVEVIGRRDIGVADVVDAIHACLNGDKEAIHSKLGVPTGGFLA